VAPWRAAAAGAIQVGPILGVVYDLRRTLILQSVMRRESCLRALFRLPAT
jgi:hypothetical protein